MTNARAEQRRQTEQRILAAARRLFADGGYDRTTIRAVAAEADIDPALVMRYFGSKEGLFAQVARISVEERIADSADVAETLLASLQEKLAGEAGPALAMLRSMLTHPQAAHDVREFMTEQQRHVADTIRSDDAELRAGLIGALILGTVLGRHLIGLDGLRDADPERIAALLRPCFRALAGD